MPKIEISELYKFIRRPIPWDPVPWWVKLDKRRLAKFNEIQLELNTRIAELEAEKVKKLSKIVGG